MMMKRRELAILCLVMVSVLAVVCWHRSTQPYPVPEIRPTLLWEKRVEPTRSRVCVVFSPDGQYLATGSGKDTISLWEPGSGRLVSSLHAPSGSSWNISFSPDSRYLATPGRVLGLLDIGARSLERELQPAMADQLSFAPNGRLLVGGGDRITIWDMSSGKIVRRFGRNDDINSMAVFSPQGDILAYGNHYYSKGEYIYRTRLYDVRQNRVVHTLDGTGGKAAFSPDGRIVALGVQGAPVVRMWNVRTGKQLRAFIDWRKVGSPCAVTFSPDGQLVAVGGSALPWTPRSPFPWARPKATSSRAVGGAITLSDARTGRILWMQKVSNMDRVTSVDFSPDGKLLAAGVAWDAKVMVWRIR